MGTHDLLSRISVDPNVCFGKPCISGHRIWVSLVLDFVAAGLTAREIMQLYPGIEESDIQACIMYGAIPKAQQSNVAPEQSISDQR